MSANAQSGGPIDLDSVPKTYEEAVRLLAYAHAEGLDDITIYSLPDPKEEVVRLIEVSDTFPEGTVEFTGRGLAAAVFAMGPARDYPYRSEVVQVTRSKWAALLSGSLRLSREWGDLNDAEEVLCGQ